MDISTLGPSTDILTSSPQWSAANLAVFEDPSSFEAWEALVNITQQVAPPRKVHQPTCLIYETFLRKYPLLFGYWKKYVDYLNSVGSSEQVLSVHKKSVEAFPQSVDLWTDYVAAAASILEDPEAIRSIIEAGSRACGMDFLSHPFWDVALEFEAQKERDTGVLNEGKLRWLKRIILLPLHQYARYWEEFVKVGGSVRPEKLTYEGLKDEEGGFLTKEKLAAMDTSQMMELLKKKIFERTQKRTMDKWNHESAITRNYFHVAPLEEEQLHKWNEYLDYEESTLLKPEEAPFNLDFKVSEVQSIYLRALVPAASLDQLWLRYTRWLVGLESVNEVRMAFRQASTVFVPTNRPLIRFNWAIFEENQDNLDLAESIYSAVLNSAYKQTQSRSLLEEATVNYLQFYRRQHGIKKTVRYLVDTITQIDNCNTGARKSKKQKVETMSENVVYENFVQNKTACEKSHIIPVLAVEVAKLVRLQGFNWRSVFDQYRPKCVDSTYFWTNNFVYECESLKHPYSNIPSQTPNEINLDLLVKFSELLKTQANIPPSTIVDMLRDIQSLVYNYGSNKKVQQFIAFDAEINGSFYCQNWLKKKIAHDGRVATTNKRLRLEAGHPGFEMETGGNFDATCQRYVKEMRDANGQSVA
ncbi:hypothetical protein LXG23DRAFT_55893 [Yarrowia lipolytica]|jgi:pre-mRNA-processing factor 39|uniref:Uncharacterized protein n=1 Tax=Yarrowia lipolytica TaxID=4952 RepID=A0A1D8NET0_YARLL|nr:hypothetical protein YALI1_D20018g [Yarrowia lipolytica]KAB8281970.1 hypothetical protein BKA91DRAFT_139389 [Yarrowia lipolytica]KAE8170657.1 hypothetical protein BKA90DRAFT_140386 [Yarrowia lipolytica]KAJ8054327.1 hypothetical protein LXG23DRAFT_55893 [Yarrowia lipolytica]QNP97880.1 Pre-mRNA-processing factor 39 [Yarrowia lipolytica]